jgi:hypothetical protein
LERISTSSLHAWVRVIERLDEARYDLREALAELLWSAKRHVAQHDDPGLT